MPDVDSRPDTLEQKLTTLGERMDARFQQVDARFQQVDARFQQVDERFQQVDERFGVLEAAVQKLRVLSEDNATQIRTIAEVQTHHGQVLQRLVEAVEPLKPLPKLMQLVARDHERRITALEQARGG